jgi:hypothetical protein
MYIFFFFLLFSFSSAFCRLLLLSSSSSDVVVVVVVVAFRRRFSLVSSSSTKSRRSCSSSGSSSEAEEDKHTKEEEKESKGESLSIGHPCANLIALINLFFSQSNTYVRYFTCRFLKEFPPHGITPFLKRTLHLQLAHLHVHSQRKSENERTSENILSA